MYIQLLYDMITVQDTSDPNHTLTYSGMCMGTNYEDKSRVQTWTIVDGVEGEMLFIDDQHQSTLQDEYIYHETFVHSLMSGILSPRRVLILGGAEGCMAREVLKWPGVERVVQVDWDKSLVDFFRTPKVAARWNQGAYDDPRVEVYCKDAMVWLQETQEHFDAIFIDLLDPESVQDICFMKNCINLCKQRLAPNGGLACNVGRVLAGRRTPACDLADFMATEFTLPSFHRFAVKTFVPSYMGEWAFCMAVPKTWSETFHTIVSPSGLKRFSKDEFYKTSAWPCDFVESLRLFWKQESIANPLAKKLTVFEDISMDKIFEHNGC